MRRIFALFSFLFIGCATVSFDINKVDFSYEEKPHNILPLRYHDRSNLNLETAEKVVKGILATDSNVWGYYYIHHAVEITEESLYTFEVMGIPVTDILQILGFPKSIVHYKMTANIYLFDAYGDIVEIDDKTANIKKYKGFYYGYSPPIKEMSEEYKRMFGEVLNKVNDNKDRINNLLESAGTMEEEESPEIYTKIYTIIK
jgi:hypothetical protein